MERKLIHKTFQFQYVIRKALERMDCVHKIPGDSGITIMPVPFESANFNLTSGLIWVRIHLQRLPRHYSFNEMFTQALEEEIKRDFSGPVVITRQHQHLVIIGHYSEKLIPSTIQKSTAQSLNSATG